jgi:glutathione S-transferase
MKLYGTLDSPYARKARVLILEKKIPVELVVQDPSAAGSPIPAMNPLGRLPVLEIEAGRYLFDATLVTHFLEHFDGHPLQPGDAAGYWQSLWWQALGNGIIDAVVQRLLEMRRLPFNQSMETVAREEERVQRAIDAAEGVVRRRRFLVGGAFTMADVVMGVALQYTDFRYPHDWHSRAPKLARWQAGIARRKSFRETVPPGLNDKA